MDGRPERLERVKEKGISLGGLALSRLGDGDSRFGMDLEGR